MRPANNSSCEGSRHSAGIRNACSVALSILLVGYVAFPGGIFSYGTAQAEEPEDATSTQTLTAEDSLDEGTYDEDSFIIVYDEDMPDDEAVGDVVDEAATTGEDVEDVDGYKDLDATEQALADAGVSSQEEVVSEEAASDDGTGAVAVAEVPDDTNVAEVLDDLSDAPGVAYVQPNYKYELQDGYDATETDSTFEEDLASGNDDQTGNTEKAQDTDDTTQAASDAKTQATDSSDYELQDGNEVSGVDGFLENEETTSEDGDQAIGTLGSTQATNDTYCNDSTSTYNQYYLFNSKVTSAWNLLDSGKTVTVAVLDTGCNLSHSDLKSNLDVTHAWDATSDQKLSSAGVDNNGDKAGHGTHVCGIIAGVANNGTGIAGAAYNTAKVLPVRVFDDNGACYTTDILSGFEYLDGLIEDGTITNLHVINMSLGYYSSTGTAGYYDKKIQAYIQHMSEEHGVLTVCAGGNGNSSGAALTTTMFPSDFDESFSVTCLDRDGGNSAFSDYNKAKDISAPGSGITSTKNSGGYVRMTGTSMSTPLVSAIAALMWSEDGSLTTTQVRNDMTSTATTVTKNAHSASGSAGAVNAYAALAKVTGTNASTAAQAKSSQSITGGKLTATFKYSKVKKKAQTFYISATAKTARAYKKVSGSSKLTVSTTGKVTVKKKTKKGTYKIKVKITAASSSKYNSTSKTVTVTVKVKK